MRFVGKSACLALGALSMVLFNWAFAQSPQEIRDQRLALAATPGFHAGDMINAEMTAVQEFNSLMSRGKAPQAQARMLSLLHQYPYSLPGHQMMVNLYRHLKKTASAEQASQVEQRLEQYQEMLRKIVDSVLNGTECRSPDDHCRVISPVETQWVNERLQCQKPKTTRERILDVPFEVTRCEGGPVLYFDISSYPPNWLKP